MREKFWAACNALFDLGDMDKALEHHQRDLELAKQWWEFEETILCHIKSDVGGCTNRDEHKMAPPPALSLLFWLLGYQLAGDVNVFWWVNVSPLSWIFFWLDLEVGLKMSDFNGEDEGQKQKGVFSTLVANGDWLCLKGEYKKAIESYTMVGKVS